MNKKIILFWLMALNMLISSVPVYSQPSGYNLVSDSLPTRWDEGLPMGNGILGLLVWEKDGNLRFSLDRADLWDLRPVLELQQFNFKWVEQQVKNGDYEPVQKYGDLPYDRDPAPTKIPAAAVEFPSALWGRVIKAELDLETATSSVRWENGVRLETMIHKAFPVGLFRFTNLTGILIPEIKIPPYNLPAGESAGSVEGQGLERLKYATGTISRKPGYILYQQPGWGGFYYEVAVYWTQYGGTCTGYWSVQAHYPGIAEVATAGDQVNEALKSGYDELYVTHFAWWKNFWSKSSISVPDAVIESQYYRDIYKLGCVTGNGAPAITLQAIWTADNGGLPPWKGDFHNDLNVQMSYWPCYTGNYLDEASSLTDWLWSIKPACEQYTLQYFGVKGLNVPGVCTLIGQPIGGWIQYSMSPTTAAWMAQHFYLQWKYSMDDNFLRKKAYPYFQGLATYLSGILREDYGILRLPLSSSPEIHDNSIQAWYTDWTNYDLALVKFALSAASEVAYAAGDLESGQKWQIFLNKIPDFAIDKEKGLMIAPGESLKESHRHHSCNLAIYPLGLIDPFDGPADSMIIDHSLRYLKQLGTRQWTGYSFAWSAALNARFHQGDSTADDLRKFATNFCSKNSFHLNGDQRGGQYSNFTYRIFTLEGNFAFAAALQEMLLQSNTGVIELFPAIPGEWRDISFKNLRAEGAFLISAEMRNGNVSLIKIKAEHGGLMKMKMPPGGSFKTDMPVEGVIEEGVLKIKMDAGEEVVLNRGE